MTKKYKLTKTKKEYCGTTLYQIEALRDFSDVKKGEKGGYIEREDNLSQEGNCWVSGDAWVYDKLKLTGGYFYHYKEKSEEIEKVEVDEDYELLCREPEVEEPEEEPEETIEIDGRKWSKQTIKEALKKHIE